MKKLIIGNWKMNPRTAKEAVRLAREIWRGIKNIKNVEVVLVPPFVFLRDVAGVVSNNPRSKLGAQDAFWENPPAGGGAYTGEVSVAQLKTISIRYIIIGHSERRALGEADEIVNKKLKTALEAGMRSVLCVGEREKTKNEVFPQIIRDELHLNLNGIKKSAFKNLIVAYEPVWAIGTGHADSPQNVYEIVVMIRRELYRIIGRRIAEQIPIIYGGSVNANNAKIFIKEGALDGLLVGGASLNNKNFVKIVKEAGLL